MSSWKKASKTNQKTHRERHQPEHREHLGLLEKSKDYKKRAFDRQKKQKLLKLLRKKALNKNPDEYHTHMVNSRLVGGRHMEKNVTDAHTPDQIKLMESKDIRYVEYRRNIESKKIDKMQSQLHMTDVANRVKNTHVFFVESANDVKKFNLAERLDTHPLLIERKTNRIRKSELKNIIIPDDANSSVEKKKTYKELGKRIHREKELTVVQQKLQVKKNLKDKRKKKPKQVKPGTKEAPPVYKWEYERKR